MANIKRYIYQNGQGNEVAEFCRVCALQNILVDRQVGDVRLIDFGLARWDHVLHDFLRLETEVESKLVTPLHSPQVLI
jgi:serine/threonine protein kinase